MFVRICASVEDNIRKVLKMFRALLCPSSGARDYDVDYHIDRFILGLLYVGVWVRLGWSGVRSAACSPDTTPAKPHLNSNIQQTKNETTNVVINITVARS